MLLGFLHVLIVEYKVYTSLTNTKKTTQFYSLLKLYFSMQITEWPQPVFIPKFIHKNSLYSQRHSTEVLQAKEQNRRRDIYCRNTWTTSPISPLQLESLQRDAGVESSSLVHSMRRSVASQMQEPEDDVTGVAAIELADLLISFLLDKAGLICGAALCDRVRNKTGGAVTKNGHVWLQRYTLWYVIRLCDLGPRTLKR